VNRKWDCLARRPARIAQGILLAAAIGAGAMVAVDGTASAAAPPGHPDYAAQATSFQNVALKAAMTRAPKGMRVSPSEVEWNDYAVVMTVPAAATKSTLEPNVADTCPAPIIGRRWTCVYDDFNFRGVRLQFSDAGYYQDLHYYGGGDWVTHSWSNTRSQRSWLNYYPGSGNHGLSYCMTGNAHAGVLEDAASTDRWIILEDNPERCGAP
jgi:hypothetical protein